MLINNNMVKETATHSKNTYDGSVFIIHQSAKSCFSTTILSIHQFHIKTDT